MDYIINIGSILQKLGLSQAIICPGSRSAPITLAFARNLNITTTVVYDERAAAYIALGMALCQKKPVAVVTTSGTAAINLYPAIAEAFFQQIPLIAITADRPPEWIGQREGQSVYQFAVFSNHVKMQYNLPVDKTGPEAKHSMCRMIAEAYHIAHALPQGPVHINVPLREPLYPAKDEVLSFENDITPVHYMNYLFHSDIERLDELKSALKECKKVMIVVGQNKNNSALRHSISKLDEMFVPVIAEPLSNTMGGNIMCQAIGPMLNQTSKTKQIAPEVLITTGGSLVSKTLRQYFLTNKPRYHFHIAEETQLIDPFQTITHKILMNPEIFFEQLPLFIFPAQSYHELWVALNREVNNYVEDQVATSQWNELSTFQCIIQNIPNSCNVHLSNSLPVRYLNYFSKSTHSYFCNRGTSGIDGCTSTAVGFSLAQPSATNVLITGDIAFLYDKNAFWLSDLPQNLKIFVFNNHGGGIFKTLTGPSQLPENDRYFFAKQQYEMENIAMHYRLPYYKIENNNELMRYFECRNITSPGCHIVEIVTDADINSSLLSKIESYKIL